MSLITEKMAAVQPIEINHLLLNIDNSLELILEKLNVALLQLRRDIITGNTRLVDMDGGYLGRESDKPIEYPSK